MHQSVDLIKDSSVPLLVEFNLDSLVEKIQSVLDQPPFEKRHNTKLRNLYQRLQKEIENHPRLAHPRRYQFESLREDIREEGLQRLFLYLFDSDHDRLKQFDPKKGEFIQWVNFLLRNRFYREATRHLTLPMKVGRTIPEALQQRVNFDEAQELSTDGLHNPSVLDSVISCLRTDPDGVYERTHVENHPAANFQAICLARLEGISWDELEQQLGVKASTLRSFYTRALSKLSIKIKECVTD